MNVWTRLEKFSADSRRPLILAIGNFDGVHRGHQRILDAVVARAKDVGGVPAVLTFFEHPQRVLHGSQEPRLLTSPQHRLLLFQQSKIEVCFFLHFTLELSKTSPEEFVRKWLVRQLGVREVHLGYNAHFGFNRRGNGALMKQLAGELGFNFFEAEPLMVEREFVSSTLIRASILRGDLERAGQLLGRPFSVFASVVRGKGRGKGLGYPTANLKVHSEILPPQGVYPVELRERGFHLDSIVETTEFEYRADEPGEWRPGILNFGVRPTFGEAMGEPVPEVFLFNFTGNLYGKTVEVVFHPKLRDEKTFPQASELVRAIEEDVTQAERYFSALRRPLQREGKSVIL
jgi:riboflavin kinase/FMN adenylyltransferase